MVLYDLDGTLYENTDQYEYYAGRLASRLDEPHRSRFWEDYGRALAGRHALKFGRTYDLARRLIVDNPRVQDNAG